MRNGKNDTSTEARKLNSSRTHKDKTTFVVARAVPISRSSANETDPQDSIDRLLHPASERIGDVIDCAPPKERLVLFRTGAEE